MRIRPVGAGLFDMNKETDGPTDEQYNEASSRISQFFERS